MDQQPSTSTALPKRKRGRPRKSQQHLYPARLPEYRSPVRTRKRCRVDTTPPRLPSPDAVPLTPRLRPADDSSSDIEWDFHSSPSRSPSPVSPGIPKTPSPGRRRSSSSSSEEEVPVPVSDDELDASEERFGPSLQRRILHRLRHQVPDAAIHLKRGIIVDDNTGSFLFGSSNYPAKAPFQLPRRNGESLLFQPQ